MAHPVVLAGSEAGMLLVVLGVLGVGGPSVMVGLAVVAALLGSDLLEPSR